MISMYPKTMKAQATNGKTHPAANTASGGRRIQVQKIANEIVDPFPLQHQRHFINGVIHIFFFHHRLERHIAIKRYFAA